MKMTAFFTYDLDNGKKISSASTDLFTKNNVVCAYLLLRFADNSY